MITLLTQKECNLVQDSDEEASENMFKSCQDILTMNTLTFSSSADNRLKCVAFKN